MSKRGLLLVFTAGAAILAGSTAHAVAPTQRTVPCSEVAGASKFPAFGASHAESGYRLVLDTVAVPPAYLPRVVGSDEGSWSYWRKAGLIVRANSPGVTVTVPPLWRARTAIVWGNGGNGTFSSVRLVGCSGPSGTGFGYSGGFYLSSNSACVPLIFRVGTRTTTVRFGVGQRC